MSVVQPKDIVEDSGNLLPLFGCLTSGSIVKIEFCLERIPFYYSKSIPWASLDLFDEPVVLLVVWYCDKSL